MPALPIPPGKSPVQTSVASLRRRFLPALAAPVALLLLAAPPAHALTYKGEWGSSDAADGKLVDPIAIAAGPGGEIYVVDHSHNRIQKFSETGTYVTVWYQGLPTCVAVDGYGFVYVGGEGGFNVFQYKPSGDPVWHTLGAAGLVVATNLAVIPQNNGPYRLAATDASNTQAVYCLFPNAPTKTEILFRLDSPFVASGIAVSQRGDVYLLAKAGGKILHYSLSDGKFLASWGETGSTEGKFEQPGGIAVGSDGRVYVADTGNNRIQVFNAKGEFLLAQGYAASDKEPLDHPTAVAFNPHNGELYVLDAGKHRIVRYKP
jgi:DNA-binding beta-propeller fold protein YncE